MIRESENNPYCQTTEPVVPPEGFGIPTFKIGERVTIHPFPNKGFLSESFPDGTAGTVVCVVFCKSDGKTILYGVQSSKAGARFYGYELSKA